MELADDVNWKFIDLPTFWEDGTLHMTGEMDLSRAKRNRPDRAYKALSDRAEQVGGLVSRPSEDKIKVRGSFEEHYYVLHYDGSGDLYKVTIHKDEEKIADMTVKEIKEMDDVAQKIAEKAEFRGVFDNKWEAGDSTEELLDILYPRDEQSDNGTYVEVDYKSIRSGDTKTRKGEVLEVDDRGITIMITIDREDGDRHYLAIDNDSSIATLYTVKEKDSTKLGIVQQVLTYPVYAEPDWV